MPIGNNDLNLNVGLQLGPGELSRLSNSINAYSRSLPSVKMRVDASPLGRMSRDAHDFQRSLAASNSRVLAFSASAGQLYGIARIFQGIVRSVRDVNKQLTDINVIFNLSSKNLKTFSNDLFNVANETGQTFKTAAAAALEFSRQGLSVVETLKRTKDALTLTRLSGMDVVDSTKAITAALNGFNDAALDSTKIINKLATVDAAFAVSSADLAIAFQRVGSTAKDTGVSIDSLIGLVTAAQQTTARGGAVIGNALKTIFQRIQRPETLDMLRELGVQVEDLQGNIRNADQILVGLSRAYSTANPIQKNFITQLAAGVFQANQFKAILSDLAKANSIYSQSSNIASNATDAAAKRQLELNKTLSSGINETINKLTQSATKIGEIGFEPVIRKILKIGNYMSDIFTKGFEGKGDLLQNVGGFLGKGLLTGFANFFSGPGLLLGAAVFQRFFQSFATFSATAFKTFITQSSQSFSLTQETNRLIATQPQLYERVRLGLASELEIQQGIVLALRQQSYEAANLGRAIPIARGLINTGTLSLKEGSLGLGKKSFKSVGFIPEMREKMGALAGGYVPGDVKEISIPKYGKVIYNQAEKVKKFPQFVQPAIMPPSSSKAGQAYRKQFAATHGFNPYENEGFIPNYIERVNYGIRNVFKNKDAQSAVDFITKTYPRLSGLIKEVNFVKSIDKAGSRGQFNEENFSVDVLAGGSVIDNISTLIHEIVHGYDTKRKTKAYKTSQGMYEKFESKFNTKKGLGIGDLLFGYDAIPMEQNALKAEWTAIKRFTKGALSYGYPEYQGMLNKGLIPNFANFGRDFIGAIENGAVTVNRTKNALLDSHANYNLAGAWSKFRFSSQGGEFASGKRFKKGSLIWTLEPNREEAFAVEDKLDKMGQNVMGHYDLHTGKYFTPGAASGFLPYANKGLIPNFVSIPVRGGHPNDPFFGGSGEFKTSPKFGGLKMSEWTGAANTYLNNSALRAFLEKKRISGLSREFLTEYLVKSAAGLDVPNSTVTQLEKVGLNESLRNVLGIGFVNSDILKEFKRGRSAEFMNKGLVPNFVPHSKQLISYLSRVGKGHSSSFKKIQSKDSQLAKFISETADLTNPEALAEIGGMMKKNLVQITPSKYGLDSTIYLDLDDTAENIRKKIRDSFKSFEKSIDLNKGLIPNFSPLSDAVNREKHAGIPISKIRIGQNTRLVNKVNPFGLGVYNTFHEPAGLHQGINRTLSQGLNPQRAGIPNFAGNYVDIIGKTLSPQKSIELEKAIDDFKSKIRLGVINQDNYNKSIINLVNQFKLGAESHSKVNKRLNASLQYLPRTLERNYAETSKLKGTAPYQPLLGFPLTKTQGAIQGTLFGGFSGANKQLEFNNIIRQVQQPRISTAAFPVLGPSSEQFRYQQTIERLKSEEKINQARIRARREYETKSRTGRFRENFFYDTGSFSNKNLVSGGIRDVSREKIDSLQSETLQRRIAENNARRTLEAYSKNQLKSQEDLLRPALKSGGSFFGLFSPSVQKGMKKLEEIDSSRAQFLKDRQLSSALNVGFIAPMVAGFLQEGFASAFGQGNKYARGGAQSFGSIGNIVSSTALGATLFPGPAGAIGGFALGSIAELPKIFKSFTDELPDLQKKFGDLNDTIQKTGSSIDSFITISEQFSDATEKGGITLKEYERLRRERGMALGGIPNVPGRDLIRGFVQEGKFSEARETGANIMNLLAQRRGALDFRMQYANFKRDFFGLGSLNLESLSTGDKDLFGKLNKTRENVARYDFPEMDEYGNIIEVEGGKAQKERLKNLEKSKKEYDNALNSFFKFSDFSAKIQEMSNNLLSQVTVSGKSFAELVSKGDLTKGTESVSEFVEKLKLTAQSSKDFDEFSLEGIKEFGNGLKLIESGFAKTPEDAKKFKEMLFSLFDIKQIEESNRLNATLAGNAAKAQRELYALNKWIFESQRKFDELGTSIKISGIDKLGDLSAKLKSTQIEEKISNQIELLNRGGEGLRGFFNLQEGERANQSQRGISVQNLLNQSTDQTFSAFSDFREKFIDGLRKGLEKSLPGQTNAAEVQKRLNVAKDEFAGWIDPFIKNLESGGQIDSGKLKEIIDSLKNQMGFFEKLSGSGSLPLEIIQLRKKFPGATRKRGTELSEADYGDIESYDEEIKKLFDIFKTDTNEKNKFLKMSNDELSVSASRAGAGLEAFNSVLATLSKNSDDLSGNLAKINADFSESSRVMLKEFLENIRMMGAAFENERGIKKEVGAIDIRNIATQAGLGRQMLGANFEQVIRLQNQQQYQGEVFGRLKEAAKTPSLERFSFKDTGIGGVESELAKAKANAPKDLNEQITGLKTFIGPLPEEQKKQRDEQLKNLIAQKDEIMDLTRLYDDLLQYENERNQRIREQLLLRKYEMNLLENRTQEIARQNKEDSMTGNFSTVQKRLGETFITGLSYSANDFWNEMSEGVLDFSQDFKGAFVQGFSEAARGATTFGEAMRSIGLNIAGSITDKITSLGINYLLGQASTGLKGLFGPNTKNKGGLIHKYARGGFVSGGSGFKDDVPALLGGGEFVLNNRATRKLGKNFLDRLNFGTPRTLVPSGGISSQISDYTSRTAPSTSISQRRANFILKNEWNPGVGFDVDPLLSTYGLTDEDNPQNILKFARERWGFEKSQYDENKRKVLRQWQKQRETGLWMGIGMAALSAAAAGFSAGSKGGTAKGGTAPTGQNFDILGGKPLFNPSDLTLSLRRGGAIRKYGFGGHVFGADSSIDTVPAMLTGGEYVMNKNAVSKHGVPYFEWLNRASGYQTGGLVGNTSYSDKDNLTDYLMQSVGVLQEIRDNITNNKENLTTKGTVEKTGDNKSAPVNNISITVNVSSSGSVDAKTDISTGKNAGNKEESSKEAKNLGEMIKNQVLQVINEQSRNGGVLEQKFAKK